VGTNGPLDHGKTFEEKRKKKKEKKKWTIFIHIFSFQIHEKKIKNVGFSLMGLHFVPLFFFPFLEVIKNLTVTKAKQNMQEFITATNECKNK
jgi:hypothetical protein